MNVERLSYAQWHEEWRRREQAIRVKLGIPGYKAHSRIAVGLPPCPPPPSGQLHLPAAVLFPPSHSQAWGTTPDPAFPTSEKGPRL